MSSTALLVPEPPVGEPVPPAPVAVTAVLAPTAGHPGPADGWVPEPVCHTGCLPVPGPPTVLERLRVWRRLAALFVVLGAAVVVIAVLGARILPLACRTLLRAVGVRVRVRTAGAAPGGAELIVANHLSWIDVLALNAARPGPPMRTVAKNEVRGWPLVGALAVRCGALFLDRRGLRALPATVATTAGVLRAGGAAVVFPEGTTWCGVAAGPFYPAAFQAALDAGVPVRPVAVVLRGPDGRRAPETAYVGEQTLLAAMRRMLRLRHVTCELTWLPALAPTGTRRDLARRAGAAIAAVTGTEHGSAGRRPA
jgi:1-acyl-sn-glycerol-3-phosphate acyltransferase